MQVSVRLSVIDFEQAIFHSHRSHPISIGHQSHINRATESRQGLLWPCF
jgi:hypothetical protein